MKRTIHLLGACALAAGLAGTSGLAAQAPAVAWSPVTASDGFDYGTIPAGHSVSQAFTLANGGRSASSTLAIALTGSAAFVVDADDCTGRSLGPGRSCTVTVRYTSASLGQGKMAWLSASGVRPGTGARASLALTGRTGGFGADLPECPALGTPLFSHSVVALDSSVAPTEMVGFRSLSPLGNLSPPGHVFPTPHMYWNLKYEDPLDPRNSPTVTASVFAPADLRVLSVRLSQFTYADPARPVVEDHSIVFSVCRQFMAYFHHLGALSPALAAAFDARTPVCDPPQVIGDVTVLKCGAETDIPVAGGELLAEVGGAIGLAGFDLGAMDGRVPPAIYANPDRHDLFPNGLGHVHIVCPVDYFTPDLRAFFETQFRDPDGLPVPSWPVCGTVAQDVPGTAKGNWYKFGAETYPEDQHLALANYSFNAHLQAFSVGTSSIAAGLDMSVYAFTPTLSGPVNRDFASVVPGAVYCYEAFDHAPPGERVILLEMPDTQTVRLEARAVATCASLGAPESWALTGAATLYER